MFGLTDDKEVKSATKYIHDLKEKLKKSYQLASTSAEKSHMRQKKGYDERVKGAILHKVLEQPNIEIPVFVVRKENGSGRKRTLHRNNLLPIGSIDVLEEEVRPVPEPRKPVPKPRLRRNQPQKELLTKVISDVETVTDSEDESFVVMWNEPENEKETDVIVPSDDEIDTVPDEIDVPGNVDDDQVRTSEPDSDSVEDAQDADDELQTQDLNEENDEANSFVQDAPVEESEEAEEDEEDEEEETSDNVVRRSTRTKISTATTKYKDFVAKSAQKTNWMIRAEYLKSAASSGIFSKYGDDVSKAMLQLITKSDD
ncbi:Hypothetical predicted protein [Mytilus galloprovincialis]|uniref:Uncharacterized protein n=1 Tax=Mytilus galloprovincialis TaxID=29158 RepID=A0A8B6E6S9_MYTGA|nr:Hypothetical predicted protein [Mytilus galloprovincialis]